MIPKMTRLEKLRLAAIAFLLCMIAGIWIAAGVAAALVVAGVIGTVVAVLWAEYGDDNQ